jgi:hypothetical protein
MASHARHNLAKCPTSSARVLFMLLARCPSTVFMDTSSDAPISRLDLPATTNLPISRSRPDSFLKAHSSSSSVKSSPSVARVIASCTDSIVNGGPLGIQRPIPTQTAASLSQVCEFAGSLVHIPFFALCRSISAFMRAAVAMRMEASDSSRCSSHISSFF